MQANLLGGESACLRARECPISGTSCPGECVFAEVMQSGSLGVFVLDLAKERVLFANATARNVIDGAAARADDYEQVSAIFGVGDGSHVADGGSVRGEPVRLGNKLVGFTTYRSRHFAWVLLRDITETARLEAVAEAVELTNNLGYVFSAVRHELGNPVNSMKAALGWLISKGDTLPREVVTDYLARLSGEVSRIESLLGSLKSYSLYEAPSPVAVDLGRFIAGFEHVFAGEYRARGVVVEVDPGPAGSVALCDERALQHVLLIVLTNAAEALGATAEPTIRIRVWPSNGFINIEVVDNGPGLGTEDQRRVFAPFFTTKSHGTGLGLVIAKKTMSRMNGTIGLESAPGGGTVALLSLPRA